jgi:hypothetical protein
MNNNQTEGYDNFEKAQLSLYGINCPVLVRADKNGHSRLGKGLAGYVEEEIIKWMDKIKLEYEAFIEEKKNGMLTPCNGVEWFDFKACKDVNCINCGFRNRNIILN